MPLCLEPRAVPWGHSLAPASSRAVSLVSYLARSTHFTDVYGLRSDEHGCMFTSVVSQCSDKRHPFRDSLSTFGGVAVRTCGSCFTGGRPNRGCDLILPPLMRMCTPIQAAPPLLPVRLLSNGVSIGLELACRATAALPSGEESGQSRRLRDAFTSRSIISPVSGQTRNLSIFPVYPCLERSRRHEPEPENETSRSSGTGEGLGRRHPAITSASRLPRLAR